MQCEGTNGRSRTSLTSPRRLRAKYTHRTNLTICTLCISPLQGADIRNPLRCLLMNAAASQYSERASLYKHLQCLPAFKCCRICVHAGYGNEFVNGHLCVHSQWHNRHQFSKKGGNAYCKKFIYTDVKTDKSKRQD